jgi:SAM-dependent methyltransferase
MKPEEDAFGQSLLAYYKSNESFQIIERNDSYIDYMDTKAYFTTYEEWALHEREALSFVKGRVLDIGCGAGRHSLYLQEKGLDVLGIDISPLTIEVCKLRGLKKAQVKSIEEANFKPDSFDTILMMGNNFGLFGSFQKAKRLLKKFYLMTSKNAIIIAATNDVYKTDNPDHLNYQKANREKGRMSGQIRIRVRFEKYASKWFDYLMVSKEEMKAILEGTGWHVKQYLDSEGSNYLAIIEKR